MMRDQLIGDIPLRVSHVTANGGQDRRSRCIAFTYEARDG
jgi:hypothetical protein